MQRDGNRRDERKNRRKKRLFSRVVLSSLSLSLSLSILCKSIISRGPRRVRSVCLVCSSPSSQTTLFQKQKGQRDMVILLLLLAAPAAAACKPQAVFDRSYTNEGSPVVSKYFEIMGYKYVQYYSIRTILSRVYYSFFLSFFFFRRFRCRPFDPSFVRSKFIFFVRSFRLLRSLTPHPNPPAFSNGTAAFFWFSKSTTSHYSAVVGYIKAKKLRWMKWVIHPLLVGGMSHPTNLSLPSLPSAFFVQAKQ